MRWSERLWRLRECWRKLGALAGKGASERLDYTCDLIMEAWVGEPGLTPEQFAGPYFRGVPSTYHRPDGAPSIVPSPYFLGVDGPFVVREEDLVRQPEPVVKAPPPSAGEAALEELRRWWR